MSASKRILFVSPRFSEGATIGGAETLLKNLALRLLNAGHEITFLATCATNHFTWENDLPAGEREVDGMKVILFPVDQDRDLASFLEVQDAISRGTEVTIEEEEIWLKNNVNSTALCDFIRTEGDSYDHILMGPYLFGLIYYASLIHPDKTCLVPCLHDEHFAYLESFKTMFKTADRIIFNSEPEKVLAEQLYDVSNPVKTVVGMGLPAFEVDDKAFATKRNFHHPYIIYSGRREGLKGTTMLTDYITAFRRRTGHDIKVVMTGSGHIEMQDDLIPHLLDVGFVSEQEKQEAMAGAVAFCHPSALESFGIVVLESWLAGTPALVNAHSEVLKDHCAKSNGGLWFRNYPEFEAELKMLLEKPETGRKMGANGREYVCREYSWEAIDQKLSKALQ